MLAGIFAAGQHPCVLSCLPTTEDLLWIPQIGAEALLNLVAAVSHSSIYDRRFDAGCARCAKLMGLRAV